jgi:hypothetical protein
MKRPSHNFIPGDRVEVPEQIVVGRVIAPAGVGVVRSVKHEQYGKTTRDLLIIATDGCDGQHEYFPRDVRWMGGPEG